MSKSKKEIYPPSVLLPVRRIIAIGDIHGDYIATLIALKKGGLIDDKKHWIGGDTIVVQLGDQIDRGGRMEEMRDEDSEIKIMNLLDKLHLEAVKRGGAVYSLIGNHEVMNTMGDFTYTSSKGLEHFGGTEERHAQFRAGGKIAVRMAHTRNVVMRIGDWIFVHGGISAKLAKKYSILEINTLMREYLLGNEKLVKDPRFKKLFTNMNGLLWTRKFSEERPDCKDLAEAVAILGGKRMVVGHTPQPGVNCKCRNSIWRVDTGMSEAFGKRGVGNDHRIEILEILNNQITNIL